MGKELLNKIFIFLLFTISFTFAGDINEILNHYFEEERNFKGSYNNIIVLSQTYAEFNPIGGFADGRYKLIDYRINLVEPNIYLLKLSFEKKKGSFRFNQTVYYYFWYDGYVIAFKTEKGKYKYLVPKPYTKIVKKGNEYIIKKEPSTLKVILPARSGKVYLYLLFK